MQAEIDRLRKKLQRMQTEAKMYNETMEDTNYDSEDAMNLLQTVNVLQSSPVSRKIKLNQTLSPIKAVSPTSSYKTHKKHPSMFTHGALTRNFKMNTSLENDHDKEFSF